MSKRPGSEGALASLTSDRAVAAAGAEPPVDPAAGTAAGTAAGGVAPVQRQSVARAALWTFAANAVLPLTALASGPILARALGPDGRGVLAAVLSPVFVLVFVAGMGLPEATVYAIARLKMAPRQAVSIVARLSLAYGTLAAVGLFFVAPTLLHRTPEAVPLLRTAALLLPLLMVVIVLRHATAGSRDFRTANLERVLSSLARLASLVILAVLGWLTVTTAAFTNFGATLLGGAFLLYFLLRRPRVATTRPAMPRRVVASIMAFGLRGWGGVFANLVNWRLDQAIMVALVDARQLGFYAVAVSFAELPSQVLSQVKNVLFAESAARDNLRLVARATRVLLVVTTLASLVGIVAAPFAMGLLFGSAFAPAVAMAQVLLVGNIFFTLEQVLASGLLSAGHPGRRSSGQILAAVLTLAGLLLLTPHVGAIGAAYTSLVAYGTNFLVTLVLFSRTTGIAVREALLIDRSDVAWLGSRMAAVTKRASR